jgi:hypothetical protein
VNLLSLVTDGRTGGCMRYEILPQIMRLDECEAIRWIQRDIERFGSAINAPAVQTQPCRRHDIRRFKVSRISQTATIDAHILEIIE